MNASRGILVAGAMLALLVALAGVESAPAKSNRLQVSQSRQQTAPKQSRPEKLEPEESGEIGAVDPEFDALTGNPEANEAGEAGEASEASEAAAAETPDESLTGRALSLGSTGSFGLSGFGGPSSSAGEESQSSPASSADLDDESSAAASQALKQVNLDNEQDSDEPTGLDSNIANAKVRLTANDMQTAAGHHHHSGHYPSGWLAMGAHTGKKGAFGWHSKHPVGGKGRR